MRGRASLRPADGAVIGAILGALLFALFVSNDGDRAPTSQSTSDSGSPQAARPTTTTTLGVEPVLGMSGEGQPTTGPNTACCPDPTSPVASAPVAGSGSSPIDDLLGRLRIEDEPPRTGYDRERFGPSITGPGGCSVREQVLINESRTPAQVDPYGCKVVAGDWVSAYDGVATDRPEDLEIDHVVALAEAWDSGASRWDDVRRRAFASDLDDAGALIAVSTQSNLAKSDSDPGWWKPANPAARCQFATDWVNVKIKWNLAADPKELAGLRSLMQEHCPHGVPSGSSR